MDFALADSIIQLSRVHGGQEEAHIHQRLYLPSEMQTEGGFRLLPPPVTAITVEDRDQCTQVTQKGLDNHLSGRESSEGQAVNTSPSAGRNIAFMFVASGCAWICVCLCAHMCGWDVSKVLMASLHSGYLVSFDNVAVVSLVFSPCLQMHVSHKNEDEDTKLWEDCYIDLEVNISLVHCVLCMHFSRQDSIIYREKVN